MAGYDPHQGRDYHVRRDGDAYGAELLTFLPTGQAWPREPGSTMVNALVGLAYTYGYVDGRAADLLERESDPRKTIELLPDWEQAWGLPDPCFPKATTIAERQQMLVLYMTWLGGQSRQYYIDLMNYLGFGGDTPIEIKEWSPFMAGVSHVGDTRPIQRDANGNPIMDGDKFIVDTTKQFRWYIGPPEMRFYWSINPGMVSVTWFRAASGQAGVDPHCRLGVPQDMQCLINRWKPAHTQLVYDFSQSPTTNDPMYGTP